MISQTVRDVQIKILDIMKYIDSICRKHNIVYFIMGGTALGAVRHGGFIPWDDDLDIFMTPDNYAKFRYVFERENNPNFYLQEWKTTPDFLEYAKVRMNGTTFIEHNFLHTRMHQGIYVDIMMLHKVPSSKIIQKLVYFQSKYVTLYGLSQRNWKPKSKFQSMILGLMKCLPNRFLVKIAYKWIYKYDNLEDDFYWCYWITPAKFKKGLFDPKYFTHPIDIRFEDTELLGSKYIRDYLSARYGDYMTLPSKAEQIAAVHAEIYDTEKDYSNYIN